MSATTTTLAGKYFDGREPIGIPATLVFTGREAALIGADIAQRYIAAALRVSPRIGRADRFVALPDGTQFQCPDNPLLDRLPHDSQAEGVVAWLEQRLAVAIVGVVLIAAVLLSGYFFGLPVFAERIAARVPIETERALGDRTLAWFDDNHWFNPSQLAPNVRDTLRRGFDELRDGLPQAPHYRLEFRDSAIVGANAFALPGGTIVITDAMVNTAESPEEIFAVFAHEMGHVEHRHALRTLLQNSAVGVAAAAVTGDAASLSVAVAGLPMILAQAKYSRVFELEADDFAFDLLKRHGRSPDSFADLMERLSARHGEPQGAFAYIASHPLTAERIKRARAAASGERGAR
jgi:predicted Zn-dependent protease